MESLGLNVTYNFFKKRMDYFRWIDKQQRTIEQLFDCQINGGPLTVWEQEIELWSRILKKEQSIALLETFAFIYGYGKLNNEFTYEWYDDGHHDEKISLSAPVNDDNWLKVIWDTLLSIETGE